MNFQLIREEQKHTKEDRRCSGWQHIYQYKTAGRKKQWSEYYNITTSRVLQKIQMLHVIKTSHCCPRTDTMAVRKFLVFPLRGGRSPSWSWAPSFGCAVTSRCPLHGKGSTGSWVWTWAVSHMLVGSHQQRRRALKAAEGKYLVWSTAWAWKNNHSILEVLVKF